MSNFARGHFDSWFLYENCRIFNFSSFLNAIMDKIYWASGQFVLGIVSGTLQVAIYAIAMQFMMMFMNFFYSNQRSCSAEGDYVGS